MSCDNKKKNLKDCTCDYECLKKGLCCECVSYHRESGDLPACLRGNPVRSNGRHDNV